MRSRLTRSKSFVSFCPIKTPVVWLSVWYGLLSQSIPFTKTETVTRERPTSFATSCIPANRLQYCSAKDGVFVGAASPSSGFPGSPFGFTVGVISSAPVGQTDAEGSPVTGTPGVMDGFPGVGTALSPSPGVGTGVAVPGKNDVGSPVRLFSTSGVGVFNGGVLCCPTSAPGFCVPGVVPGRTGLFVGVGRAAGVVFGSFSSPRSLLTGPSAHKNTALATTPKTTAKNIVTPKDRSIFFILLFRFETTFSRIN